MSALPRHPAARLLRAVLFAAWLYPCLVWAGGTEVILSPDRAGATVDRDMLRAIFTTRLRQWPDGTPVRVFVLPDDAPLHDQFCREQLGMYPYVLRDIWDRLQFTGTGLVPTQVRSVAEMRDRVRSTRGAIGYVPSGAGSGGNVPENHPAQARAAGPQWPELAR